MCYSSKWRIVTTDKSFANAIKAAPIKEPEMYEYLAHNYFEKKNVLTYVITWGWLESYESETLIPLIEKAEKDGISFLVQQIGENADDRKLDTYNNAEHWSEASFEVVFYGFEKS